VASMNETSARSTTIGSHRPHVSGSCSRMGSRIRSRMGSRIRSRVAFRRRAHWRAAGAAPGPCRAEHVADEACKVGVVGALVERLVGAGRPRARPGASSRCRGRGSGRRWRVARVLPPRRLRPTSPRPPPVRHHRRWARQTPMISPTGPFCG
jgi:hypothetical protein